MKVARRGIGPYVIVLLITLYLFYEVSQLDFVAPAGRPGPDIWPRLVLLLTAAVSVYEIVRRLVASPDRIAQVAPAESPIDVSGDETGTDETSAPKYPGLVVAGLLLSVGYVALLGTLGFFLCTTLFLAAFMLLGGYRRLVTIAVSSLVGGLVFMFTFMKVVYVSLPLGVEPFSQVSLALMRLMNIR